VCDIPRGSNPGAGLVYTRDVGGGAAAVAMKVLWVARYKQKSKQQPGALLPHNAHHPDPRWILLHVHQYARLVVSVGGVSAAPSMQRSVK